MRGLNVQARIVPLRSGEGCGGLLITATATHGIRHGLGDPVAADPWLRLVGRVAGLLIWRFLKTGGPAMLRMMNRPAAMGHSH
jgi:hypothetical protein